RLRIVDRGADTRGFEPRGELGAAGRAHGVVVIDVVRAGELDGPDQTAPDRRPVAGRVRATLVVPGVQVAELDPEDRRLDLVEAAVEADLVVQVAAPAAVRAQHAQPLADRGVGRRHHAAVAGAAQVLGRVEAETG